jgi:hypothetical protein
MTGKRLAAGLDERAGTHALRSLGKWSEVEDAFDLWAQRFSQRLRDLRDRPKPDAN